MKEIIKEIVFDFDGVFADTTLFCAKEVQIVGESLTGKHLSIETILSGWGAIFDQYLKRFYPGVTLDAYFAEKRRLGLDKELPPRVFGARRTINVLSKTYPLSIVTNREKTTFEQLLDGLDIDRSKFKFIQSCSDTPFHKPDPRVFERYWKTLDRTKIYPNQILYVGDHLVDHQAATAANFQFVGVLSGKATNRQDFLDAGVDANSILDSVWDLPKHLNLE